ncbi:MAG: hypothetical protein OSB63_01095 [Planctomycetota bacterium]|nr:hypothetical protein [Planctomycetota bacterium]
MKNDNNHTEPLSADVKVSQQSSAQQSPLSKQPVRKSLSTGSIGLIFALAGLLLPYPLREYAFLPSLVAMLIVWELLSNGLLRINQSFSAHKPFIPFLALITASLPLFVFPVAAAESSASIIGACIALWGAALALLAPMLGKKYDTKLPAAPAEPETDAQFSKSLLAYLLVLGGLPLMWAADTTGLESPLGSFTFLFCLIGAWASWAGMWKMWSMPAITSGMLGLVLFLAPLEAIIYGLFGLLRVVTGTDGPIADQWAGNVDAGFLAHGVGPMLVLGGGLIATYELFHGAKKGMAANKAKKQAEVDARKAQRKSKQDAPVSPVAETNNDSVTK